MRAIWNSYSKSDTARIPRTMQSARSRATRSMRRPSKARMVGGLALTGRASSIMASRSFTVNSGALLGLATTATISSSKMRRLRSITSMCPLWTGSNMPGYTARLPTGRLFLNSPRPAGAQLPVRVANRIARETAPKLPPGSKESQGRLPEAPGAEARERGQRSQRRRALGEVLGDDQPARARQSACSEDADDLGNERALVGGVQEDDVEHIAGGGQPGQGALHVHGQHPAHGLEIQRLEILAERLTGPSVPLHEGGPRRAPGQRLDAHAARAREQVEDPAAGEIRGQGVHEGD